jgi:hypothetical protein
MPISVVRLLSDDGDHPMILLNSFAPPALDGGAASIASEAGFFPLKITEASGPTLKRPAIFVLRIVWCTDGHSLARAYARSAGIWLGSREFGR